jgi:heat shock protein HslJ
MKRIFLGIMLVMIILSFSLTGCREPDASSMQDSRWILLSYGDPETPYAVLPDTQVTARFNSGTKQLRGSGGCNTYTGEYEIEENSLTVTGPFAVTEMWCGDEIGAQESAYLDILLAAESYEIDENILQIHCGNDVLYFERE